MGRLDETAHFYLAFGNEITKAYRKLVVRRQNAGEAEGIERRMGIGRPVGVLISFR